MNLSSLCLSGRDWKREPGASWENEGFPSCLVLWSEPADSRLKRNNAAAIQQSLS